MTAQATALSHEIERKAEGWGWADNKQNYGALQTAQHALMSQLTPFDKEWMITEQKDIVNNYGEEHLTVHVGNVCKLEQLIDGLASEHKRLMAMFKAQSAQ